MSHAVVIGTMSGEGGGEPAWPSGQEPSQAAAWQGAGLRASVPRMRAAALLPDSRLPASYPQFLLTPCEGPAPPGLPRAGRDRSPVLSEMVEVHWHGGTGRGTVDDLPLWVTLL